MDNTSDMHSHLDGVDYTCCTPDKYGRSETKTRSFDQLYDSSIEVSSIVACSRPFSEGKWELSVGQSG